MFISPIGFALIASVILVPLHYILIKRFRKFNAKDKTSWIMWIGNLLVPIIVLGAYLFPFILLLSGLEEIINQWTQIHDSSDYLVMLGFTLIYWQGTYRLDRSFADKI